MKPRTEKWFLNRISKRIHRDLHACCNTCEKVYDEGIIVKDEKHAKYLSMVDSEFSSQGTYLNYRDSEQ